jgi:N-acetylneuraminic acid mutarotase
VETFAMIDFDPFERRLAVALRSDADLSVPPFDPASIARAATQIEHARQRRVVRMPRRIATMDTSARFAAAAVIAVIAVGGAFYLLRPGQPAVGTPSPTPSASSSPAESADPSPTFVPARPASWTATGSMAGQVHGGIAVVLQDGRVLVMGGFSSPGPAAEVYDPRTGTWTATGPMVTPRWQSAAVRLLDGRVLVASGAGDPGVLASAELYDPRTDSWTATGSSATARYYATLTLLDDGKVLLAGGDKVTHSFNPSVASAELYDPATGSWTQTGSMHTARSLHIAMLLPGGKVLVVGGWNENDTLSYPLASAEVYDPATGTWAAAHDMLESTSVQTATLLANGRILVVGGTYELPTPEFVSPWEGIAASAELYDPAADAWTMTGDLGKTVRGYTATLLSDGRVLVAGGMDRPWTAYAPASASAAVYDPSTGTWGATRDMIEGRSEHTATLLPDGMVLVAGGIIGLGSNDDGPGILGIRASAELYDPGTGR